jgi:hypothetical protein
LGGKKDSRRSTMNRTRSLLVAAAAVLCLAASDAANSEVASFISEFVGLYQSGKFAEAARLFHCPPSYTSAELEADRKAVEASLRILSSLYGPIQRVASESAGSISVASSAGCGTAEYWKGYPVTMIRILKTEQRESEQGYLEFQFASVGGKTVLFMFGHGLPATNPEARSRVESFFQRKLAQ